MDVYIIVLGLIGLPLNIVFHEFGHIVYYLFNRIPIKAMVIFDIICVNKNGKWYFTKTENNRKIFVIPTIYKKYSIDYYGKKICNDLLMGPLFSIMISFFWIICLWSIKDTAYYLAKLVILANMFLNFSILHSCLVSDENMKGDIIAFFKLKKNITLVYQYIMDYMMLSECVCVGFEHVNQIEFKELKEDEKIDWAFDVVTLYLLGIIDEVDDNINTYVNTFLKSYRTTESENDLVVNNFKMYSSIRNNTSIVFSDKKERGEDDVMHIIYTNLDIEENIINRYKKIFCQ